MAQNLRVGYRCPVVGMWPGLDDKASPLFGKYVESGFSLKSGECPACGKRFEFLSVGDRQRDTCSQTCCAKLCRDRSRGSQERRLWQREYYKATHVSRPRLAKKCLGCGIDFEGNAATRFHDTNCYHRWRYREQVGEPNESKCFAIIRAILRDRKGWPSGRGRDLNCEMCGEAFVSYSVRSRFCSKTCKKDFNNHLRERAIAALPGRERFKLQAVYDLYGYTCHICSEPIDPALPYPDVKSKSIDHVVPVSKGGNHTLENCRPAHFGCNARKSNKLSDATVQMSTI